MSRPPCPPLAIPPPRPRPPLEEPRGHHTDWLVTAGLYPTADVAIEPYARRRGRAYLSILLPQEGRELAIILERSEVERLRDQAAAVLAGVPQPPKKELTP